MRRLLRVTLAFAVLMALGCLVGCLKDHPLVLPENGYDPALALRNDSLARFDTVEILLVDPDDSTRAIRIFKGTTLSVDTLETHAAGDGQKLIYIVKGFKAGKGHCFTEKVTREGTVEFLWDTCAKTGNPPVEPKKPIPPQFVGTMLEVGPNDSTFTIDVLPFDSMVAIVSWEPFSIPEAVQWNNSQSMIPVQPGPAGTVELKVKRNNEWPGRFSANVIIGSPAGMDTVVVFVNVMDDSLGRLSGYLVRDGDSAPEVGWMVKLDAAGATPQMTMGDGGFDFGKRKPGNYSLEFSKGGRIGRMVTVELKPNDTGNADFAVPPAGVFQEVFIDWKRKLAGITVADNHALVPTGGFETAGEVAVFPLDNPSPSLQRFPSQGNADSVDPDEYFEAGESVGDSSGLYIAYPEANRIGKVIAPQGGSSTLNAALPFQPSGLLRSPDGLMAIGRAASGTMVLAELDPSTLALRRLDTLSGYSWDGVSALERGPRLVLGAEDYFAVDGNGPGSLGVLLRIDRQDRKVTDAKTLPLPAATDIAYRNARLYVTHSDPSLTFINEYAETNLAITGAIPVGVPAYRIRWAKPGPLQGLALVATLGNELLVIDVDWKRVMGHLPIPGSKRILSLDSDLRSGRILATDGDKVYQAQF